MVLSNKLPLNYRQTIFRMQVVNPTLKQWCSAKFLTRGGLKTDFWRPNLGVVSKFKEPSSSVLGEYFLLGTFIIEKNGAPSDLKLGPHVEISHSRLSAPRSHFKGARAPSVHRPARNWSPLSKQFTLNLQRTSMFK